MNILLIGINHKTAAVKVREKFSFTKKHLKILTKRKHIKGVSLWDLDDLKGISEKNHKKREKEAVYAEKIIDRELKCFVTNYS